MSSSSSFLVRQIDEVLREDEQSSSEIYIENSFIMRFNQRYGVKAQNEKDIFRMIDEGSLSQKMARIQERLDELKKDMSEKIEEQKQINCYIKKENTSLKETIQQLQELSESQFNEINSLSSQRNALINLVSKQEMINEYSVNEIKPKSNPKVKEDAITDDYIIFSTLSRMMDTLH